MAEYIERADAVKDLRDIAYYLTESGNAELGSAMHIAANVIKQRPAADVAVVHGRWIEKEELYFDVMYDCSACGESFCFIEGNPSNNLYNYCPNCGARMDGE